MIYKTLHKKLYIESKPHESH